MVKALKNETSGEPADENSIGVEGGCGSEVCEVCFFEKHRNLVNVAYGFH